MLDTNLIVIMSLAFLAVAALVLVGGQYYLGQAHLKRRLPVAAGQAGRAAGGVGALVAGHFSEQRFGVDGALRSKLRRELLRAGYFGDHAINYYVFARVCTVIALPSVVFILCRLFLPATPTWLVMLFVAISAGIGILGPDAFLSRRQGQLQQQYRLIFPDLLDLLVVCVGAGLSMEAAFDRVKGQMIKQHRALGMNLEMMGAEMRAGRSSLEALNSLADRLALDEATALVAVLRHSIELGGDVADALRVYSDEMRDKRMLRAEEAANKLTVKMVLPLALFIFPVILEIVLLPVGLKLIYVFSMVGHH
jgi:tight adherence protein C